jgi:hypothetical protein
MRFTIAKTGAALVCAGLLFGATQAGAEEPGANQSGCVKLADEVRDALSSNQQSQSYQAALKEKGYGRDFCTNGFYKQGVAHYAEALKILGTQPS